MVVDGRSQADIGTIVSAAVLSALPLEVPPRLLDIAFVVRFASAFALSVFVLEEAAWGTTTDTKLVTPLTVPPGICVCCVPVTLPAAVLKKIRLSCCG
jgi:hypothetical protein